jgi:16S rRNA processing protein RimM
MYLVGKVLKPRGLSGELKVSIITSFPEHFKELQTLFIQNKQQWLPYQVEQVRFSDKFVYLRFAGIQTVEQAALLRNKELYIEAEQLQKLEEGEYYIHDLIGLSVFDEQNRLLGAITNVEDFGGNDVYELELTNGERHLIPAIRDVVKKIDIENKRMTIHVMEGLLE